MLLAHFAKTNVSQLHVMKTIQIIFVAVFVPNDNFRLFFYGITIKEPITNFNRRVVYCRVIYCSFCIQASFLAWMQNILQFFHPLTLILETNLKHKFDD